MDRSNEFDLLLKLHRATLSPKERNRKIITPFFLYPLATEKLYAEQISSFMRKFIMIMKEKLEGRVKKWISPSKMDAFSDDFSAFKKEMEEELVSLYIATYGLGSPSYELLVSIAEKVYGNAYRQWKKQLKPTLGFEWAMGYEGWDELKKTWIINNQTLMEKQGKDFLSSIEALIITALQSLWSYSDLMESVNKAADKYTGYKAGFLARNEVAILNTLIMQGAYLEAGMPYYFWHTAMDERVRGNPGGIYPKAIPSHWEMEGLLMNWNNPTVYSDDLGKTWKKKTGIMEFLHVGLAPGCRCVPQPFLNDKLAKVDSNIGGLL